MATGVTTEIVTAYTDPGATPWNLQPEFHRFIFDGYRNTPNVRTYPQLSIFPTDEHTDPNTKAGKQIHNLRDFLDRKPTTLGGNEDVPSLPPWNSAQAITAGISYLDFKNGNIELYLGYPE